MRITITNINLEKVSPPTKGTLAKKRTEEINSNIEKNMNYFNIGRELEIHSKFYKGEVLLIPLGVYEIPSKKTIPVRSGIMLNKHGEIYIGFYRDRNWNWSEILV